MRLLAQMSSCEHPWRTERLFVDCTCQYPLRMYVVTYDYLQLPSSLKSPMNVDTHHVGIMLTRMVDGVCAFASWELSKLDETKQKQKKR